MTDWKYRQYIVALIDVLGQKDRLLTLDHFPESEEDTRIISETLHDTAGYIDSLRRTFQDYNTIIKQSKGFLNTIKPEHRQTAEKIRGIYDDIPIRYFSDSIIWEISVDNSDEHCKTARQVWEILYSLCATFLIALIKEKPFRGAIELGFGVPIGDQKEIYGSALVNAHLLETEIANYPRIVIGNLLWQYLTVVESGTSDTFFSKAAGLFATNAKSLMTLDNDNIRILDIIGEGAKSVTGGITKEIITMAYNSLLKIQTRHAAHDSINSIKLMTRYSLLQTYLESRLPLWQ
jgi:hypothetical protein